MGFNSRKVRGDSIRSSWKKGQNGDTVYSTQYSIGSNSLLLHCTNAPVSIMPFSNVYRGMQTARIRGKFPRKDFLVLMTFFLSMTLQSKVGLPLIFHFNAHYHSGNQPSCKNFSITPLIEFKTSSSSSPNTISTYGLPQGVVVLVVLLGSLAKIDFGSLAISKSFLILSKIKHFVVYCHVLRNNW